MSEPQPSELSVKSAPTGEPSLRTFAMPADANPTGDIFGGWLLSQMDLAGASTAARRVRGRVVTVAINGMAFHSPVFIGDEVSCYTQITRIGRTSLTVLVEAWRRAPTSDETIKVTEGQFTFVAIGADRRPKPIER